VKNINSFPVAEERRGDKTLPPTQPKTHTQEKEENG
jgi:hypothetical protein